MEQEDETRSRPALNGERALQVFTDFFSFTGEIDRAEFARRVKYLPLAALFSVFWFALPQVQSLLLLGTVASLSSLIVRRLRNLNCHWAIVFIGLLPVLGWIVLAVIVTLKATETSDDTLSGSRRLLSGGATFVALALLLTSGSVNATQTSSTTSESAPSVEALGGAEQEQLAADQAAEAEAEAQAVLDEAENVRLAEEAARAEDERKAAEAENLAPKEPEVEASNQSFEDLIARLTVQPEVTGGYDRDLFKHWIDTDGDGCNTREEVLISESVTPVSVGGSCSLSGGTWVSAFDGVSTTNPSEFDVDHFVPLKEAWDSGANAWDSTTRQNFANDLGYEMSLIAVSASSNRSKSDRDPSGWMPSEGGFKCEYVYAWIQVKLRWNLSIDTAEATALRNNWSGCSVGSLEETVLVGIG
jgi:uncharacterized membrane protein YhaH (DUF805 family)